MPIVTKDEQLPTQPVIILLIGDPGTAKTSLSNTCKNVLNIDFDLGFKRSYGRPDSLQLTNGWAEVVQALASGEFDKYDTIVIDTAKGCLDDFLMVYVQEQDYKLKTNKLKAFGAIGEEFKNFINIIRRKGKDIFIIAHSKKEGEGDSLRIIADITGQSNALLLRVADQVGFLSMRNNKRVITFNPTDISVGKNVANLKDIELPPHTSAEWSEFAHVEIIEKVKNALNTMSEEQRASLELIKQWRKQIDEIAPTEDHTATDDLLKRASAAVAKITPEHMKAQIRAYLVAHVAAIGWQWVGDEKVFKPIAAVAPPVEEKKDETPPAVPPAEEKPPVEAEAQRAELANATTPQINKNPHLAPPKNDLFAKAEDK